MKTEYQHLAQAMIRDSGGRVTQPRLQVLEYLLAQRRLLTQRELGQGLPEMDRVSLYRSIKWLWQHQLVARVDSDDGRRYGVTLLATDDELSGSARFAVKGHAAKKNVVTEDKTASQSPHFYCTSCGVMQSLPQATIPQVQSPEGFVVEQVEVVVKGLCQACSDKQQ